MSILPIEDAVFVRRGDPARDDGCEVDVARVGGCGFGVLRRADGDGGEGDC